MGDNLMPNSSKRRGDTWEATVRDHAQAHGFPWCARTRATCSWDQGGRRVPPGVRCDRPVDRRGMCASHYRVALRKGLIEPLPPVSVRDRFEQYVDRSAGPDGCHPWTGSLTSTGYGQFNGGDGLKAHRYAYRWAHDGDLDPDELVRHTCDNPPCVNPAHLVKGSQLDNVHDAIERNRFVPLPPDVARGTRNVNAKLTDDLVRQLRAEHATGQWTTRQIGDRYGISQVTAASAIRRATWSHVA